VRDAIKKIITVVFFAVLAAAIGSSTNSCAPTEPLQIDTTRLVSAPSSDTLTRADSLQSVALNLTCGCPFGPPDTISKNDPVTIAGPLIVTGYGDTGVIHFSFNEPLTTSVVYHTIYSTIDPTALKSAGSSSSWIAFYYLHNGVKQLYDTIRVTANY
jgi:hypothetical protein